MKTEKILKAVHPNRKVLKFTKRSELKKWLDQQRLYVNSLVYIIDGSNVMTLNKYLYGKK